ncbi:glycoside hydrolase family 57 protein [Candidatus Magnetobacterium casense]|uniref:DUF1957 domain-containing protein n=1 Tax=Candidatus Magnetobacterium casense TaxID=1455061 RepID=A0ABS6RZ17_9BACT|nr:1,4-alpha-glucan branching protein domain-containing protein [Candidatus Magnetobacterium casensis]MBV6341028.1 DUF1957 domain-containing protein [Candidatus Magnetobacterium casensis]
MVQGYWLPVLHSHLPFVKHPEFDYFLEEHWLFEAVSETYMPLLMRMKKFEAENQDFRLTLSVSPPLAEMLADEYLTDLFLKYLDKLIELAQKEMRRLRTNSGLLPVATFYYKRFLELKSFFTDVLNYSVLNGYKYFSQKGWLEVITCGATHGYLPLLRTNVRAVEAQIDLAVQSHSKHFGKAPDGIWLPECAYYEDLDEILRKYGLKYFFMESHGLANGVPSPKYSVYSAAHTLNGVAVFARDVETSKQVWSAEAGYPGNPDYRDFYRDIGFDLDMDYIKPYISPDGNRVFTGIKYYKITGETEDKLPYDPLAAFHKTRFHAEHFCAGRYKQIEMLKASVDRPPLIVSPYDAELYGHWWFEGPDFLYHVLLQLQKDGIIKPVTAPEYLKEYPKNQTVCPSPSSWGENGYYEVWLNDDNNWIYRHLHFMADSMQQLADSYYDMSGEDPETERLNTKVLNQLARELLLAQSSDWAFLITRGTAIEYSVKRTKEHISNFNRLLESFKDKNVDVIFLNWLEYKNSIFEDLDFRIYSSNN